MNGEDVEELFVKICTNNNILVKKESIHFPERVVTGILANKTTLSSLLLLSPNLAEFRVMKAPTSFFYDLTVQEQRGWVNDLSERIDISNRSDTSVCILDTGVNNGHPLLQNFISDDDVKAVDGSYGANDHVGHGTNMAGIVVYHDLEDKLAETDIIEINHFVESVKILNRDGADNPEELYGNITQQAVSIAEIDRPHANRTICMAVTARNDAAELKGEPSTWSGAIDSMLSYAEEEVKDKERKRLMFVSSGNTNIEDIVESGDYRTAIINHPVDDPGQAWNCITVGAYTEKEEITDPLIRDEYSPLAPSGGLSPFTSTSLEWDRKWPIKPEILCEGGNLAVDANDSSSYDTIADFKLLTTSKNHLIRPFELINGTSSATAQASWIAANIKHHYPELWPETVRALIIHSASWTAAMKTFAGIMDTSNRSDYKNLLRTCGYGVPDIVKALWSASNSVNMIVEDRLQPYQKKESSITLNEMHIHEIPWPKDILLELGEVPVTMKVTLSYYIEPGPERIGWKDKYRYPLKITTSSSLLN
jgi:hypothetical protein